MNLSETTWKFVQEHTRKNWPLHVEAYRSAFSETHDELVDRIQRIDGVSKIQAEADVKSFEAAFAAS